MVFSSLPFLCVFLPVVFVLYTVIQNLTARNILLIVASLFFYAYGEPVYVLLMIGSTFINYIFGLILSGSKTTKIRKLFMIFAVVLNLGVLGVFKYTGFILNSVNSLFGTEIPIPAITLPIGISFFTFQALSYVIDVYRGDVEKERSFLNVLLYISFFPQLIAGPIVKFHDINKALSSRTQSAARTASGFRRFICGLAKKVIIANTVAVAADAVFAAESCQLNIFSYWLGAVCYMLQIYYDFSGYSDMAIGLGKMFGFEFKENFNLPYISVNIRDFWRRWHISMSTWFKEYLYIPLGGNRKGKLRTCLNKIIVFFCTGLWHGANWTFVLWGLYHGFFQLLEEYIPAMRKLPRIVGHLYSLLVVCCGFVLFRAESITQAGQYLAGMFGGFEYNEQSVQMLVGLLTPWLLFILAVAVLGAGPVETAVRRIRTAVENKCESRTLLNLTDTVTYLFSFVLLIVCMIFLSGDSYNPFIYFRF